MKMCSVHCRCTFIISKISLLNCKSESIRKSAPDCHRVLEKCLKIQKLLISPPLGDSQTHCKSILNLTQVERTILIVMIGVNVGNHKAEVLANDNA